MSPSSIERLDELRQQYPTLGFGVYAIEPGGDVTFEVISPSGETYQFVGKTLAEAMNKAFPPHNVFD